MCSMSDQPQGLCSRTNLKFEIAVCDVQTISVLVVLIWLKALSPGRGKQTQTLFWTVLKLSIFSWIFSHRTDPYFYLQCVFTYYTVGYQVLCCVRRPLLETCLMYAWPKRFGLIWPPSGGHCTSTFVVYKKLRVLISHQCRCLPAGLWVWMMVPWLLVKFWLPWRTITFSLRYCWKGWEPAWCS